MVMRKSFQQCGVVCLQHKTLVLLLSKLMNRYKTFREDHYNQFEYRNLLLRGYQDDEQ